MELWTQSKYDWVRKDLSSLFSVGPVLFRIFMRCGMTSARDVLDSEPHRLIVFSSEECRLLGVWGEAFFDVDPAFSMLSSVVSFAVSNIGNFGRTQVPDAFPWAHICDYDDVDPGVLTRRYVPQVFFLTDGVFSLTPLEEGEKTILVVDISGRFVAELAGEMTGTSGYRKLS